MRGKCNAEAICEAHIFLYSFMLLDSYSRQMAQIKQDDRITAHTHIHKDPPAGLSNAWVGHWPYCHPISLILLHTLIDLSSPLHLHPIPSVIFQTHSTAFTHEHTHTLTHTQKRPSFTLISNIRINHKQTTWYRNTRDLFMLLSQNSFYRMKDYLTK